MGVKKLPRFIIMLDGEELTRVSSRTKIADFLGCTKQHVYASTRNGVLSYKKKSYIIIDLLDTDNKMFNLLRDVR